MKKKLNKIDLFFFVLMIIGLSSTLIYIFSISSSLLSSDSIIANIIAHQQIINKELILSQWYYGNELWLLSFNIPAVLLSFIIKNNILLKQITVFITSIIFYIILYKCSIKFLGKKQALILIAVFFTGISYSVLNYFYVFDSCLTIIINSILLLYLYYKSMEENNNKRIYYYLSISLTFLFGIQNFQYFPVIIIPFLITYFILHNKEIHWKKLGGILLITIISFFTLQLLMSNCKINSNKKIEFIDDIKNINLVKRAESLIDIELSFFGYDNKNNTISEISSNQYPTKNYGASTVLSIHGFIDFIKFVASIIFMIIAPISLYKSYNKNDKNINFLLIFNTLSWIFLILYYFFFKGFVYSNASLKYFLFNFIINMILGLYFLYNKVSKLKLYSILCNIFIIAYIISNLCSTMFIIKKNDVTTINKKMELIDFLEKNNLTFGYGSYNNSLLISYLSNYDITVANVNYKSGVSSYKLLSDERWYNKQGKVFFILDEKNMKDYSKYERMFNTADNVLTAEGFTILIYNENPFLKLSV